MSKREATPGGAGDAEKYKPLTESEMDAELDRADADEDKH